MSGGSRVAPWLTAAQFASGLDMPEPPVPVPVEPPMLIVPAVPSGVVMGPLPFVSSGANVQPARTDEMESATVATIVVVENFIGIKASHR
jgi:hypothetical protein